MPISQEVLEAPRPGYVWMHHPSEPVWEDLLATEDAFYLAWKPRGFAFTTGQAAIEDDFDMPTPLDVLVQPREGYVWMYHPDEPAWGNLLAIENVFYDCWKPRGFAFTANQAATERPD